MWNATFRLLTASLLHVVARHYISWWSVVIGAFRSGYCFHVPWFPHAFAGFSCVVGLDVSFFKASMLPVFRLRCPCLCYLGWVLCELPPSAFLVYQWLSRAMSLVLFHTGLCPVPLACSETAEFWVRASRIFLSFSFILSCMGRPVSPT